MLRGCQQGDAQSKLSALGAYANSISLNSIVDAEQL